MSTLKEVAKLCGVTPATVSYIMNGRHLDRMLPSTIQRVRAAAEKLNYRPHASARSLVTGRTETLGVYCPGHLEDVWADSYLVDVLRGIFHQCALQNFAIQVATEDVLAENRYRRQPAVDGWIAVMPRSTLPPIVGGVDQVIYLDPYKRFSGTQCLWADNVKAGLIAGEFCCKKGWRTAFVLLDSLKQSPLSYQERWEGVREAFESKKKLLHPEPLALPLAEETETAQLKATPLFRMIQEQKVDCFITASDLISCQILRDARKLGFVIPKDFRLVGIDNLPQSRHMDPPITSVDIGAMELGRQAAKLMLCQLEKKKSEFGSPEPKLIERKTT